jgi:hypothetical protein
MEDRVVKRRLGGRMTGTGETGGGESAHRGYDGWDGKR